MPEPNIWEEIDKLASDMAADFEEKRIEEMRSDPIMKAAEGNLVELPTFDEVTSMGQPEYPAPTDTDMLQQVVADAQPSPQDDLQNMSQRLGTTIDPFEINELLRGQNEFVGGAQNAGT